MPTRAARSCQSKANRVIESDEDEDGFALPSDDDKDADISASGDDDDDDDDDVDDEVAASDDDFAQAPKAKAKPPAPKAKLPRGESVREPPAKKPKPSSDSASARKHEPSNVLRKVSADDPACAPPTLCDAKSSSSKSEVAPQSHTEASNAQPPAASASRKDALPKADRVASNPIKPAVAAKSSSKPVAASSKVAVAPSIPAPATTGDGLLDYLHQICAPTTAQVQENPSKSFVCLLASCRPDPPLDRTCAGHLGPFRQTDFKGRSRTALRKLGCGRQSGDSRGRQDQAVLGLAERHRRAQRH